ncbi:unnamed protein product [Ectocarpus sp. 12 AP-2014]
MCVAKPEPLNINSGDRPISSPPLSPTQRLPPYIISRQLCVLSPIERRTRFALTQSLCECQEQVHTPFPAHAWIYLSSSSASLQQHSSGLEHSLLCSPLADWIMFVIYACALKAIRLLQQLAGSRVPGVRNPRIRVLRERKNAP